MKCFRALLCVGLMLGAVLMAAPAAAQTVTTGSIAGTIVDPQGAVLPGATVVAVHVPTGTTYEGVAQADGRFNILNVRVGGPYTVTVTMSGFRKEEETGIMVVLGEERGLNVKLRLQTVTETVTVTAEAPLIDTARAGAGGSISGAIKEALPTINRSLIDIVRINPYFNALTSNDSVTALSVAGRNSRYNSIQIDGAVNNDLFGLAATGTPGGQTDSQPISLDAIQEIQLVVSPYDVRQGGFSGGGINAITKSGSNQYRGTVFYFGRDARFVGKGITGIKVAAFSDKQGGASLGGPIRQNKAFFFGNADFGRKLTPTGFCITGCGQTFNGTTAEVDRFFSILETKYGYSIPDARKEFSRTTNSDKLIAKADVNLRSNHRLTVRHNYVNGLNDIGGTGRTSYTTPDGFYEISSKTNSTVAQLNSTFSGNAVNEFRVNFTTIRDRRGAQDFETKPFPRVTVRLAAGNQIGVGREAFSTANELDQDILEIHDDYTLLKGRHTITIGTHNEFFKFRNLFIRDNFGTYTFNTLDFFDAGTAQQFDYSFPTNPAKPDAKFGVNQLGLYVGDQWRARSNFTVTMGVRMDLPMFPDKPTANPVAQTIFQKSTDVAPKGVLWSPRIGFNWDITGDASQQIRGGIGMFAGRTPYVWLSNQYGNTGIEFNRIGASNNAANRIPFNTNPAGQPTVVTGATGSAFTNEIDLLDPEYKYPSLLRGNLAYERKLPLGLVGSAEFLYSKNLHDIAYQNLNQVTCAEAALDATITDCTTAQTVALDGRPRYTRKTTTLSDVIYLTNTEEGSAWSTMLEVRRPFSNGWFASGSYLYGRSTSVNDGNSSQAASNWGFLYVRRDVNNPELTRSNYDPGHRINLSASYQLPVWKGVTATASLYYAGQSGRPYALSFNADVNGDTRNSNDLFYIPSSATQATFVNGTAAANYADLMVFVQQDECLMKWVGIIMTRNACRAPWTNTMDFRLNLGLPFRKVDAEITWDVLNLLNLFDNKSGLIRYAGNNQLLVFPATITAATGQIASINLATILGTNFSKFFRDDLRSRWQMQLGGRIRF